MARHRSPRALLAREAHHDGSADHVQLRDGVATLRVRVPLEPGPGGKSPELPQVLVRVTADGEPTLYPATVEAVETSVVWFTVQLALRPVVTSYRFLIAHSSEGHQHHQWLNASGIHEHEIPDADDFRIVEAPEPPAWVPGTVIYQIFPDRFARTEDSLEPLPHAPEWAVSRRWDDEPAHAGPEAAREYFGGTLDGVRHHLDHVADLGIGVVYLTPFFPARSTHRYDASSFDRVDPLLGGNEALERLVRAAHERGLRVLGDFTTNHTGAAHEWFQRAQDDPDSTEAGFYYFIDHPHEYHGWMGVKSLPKLDYGSLELRERMYRADDSALAQWLRTDGPLSVPLDGWRIDVANMTGRQGADDYNAEVAAQIAARMRELDAERPPELTNGGSWLLGEHFHDAGRDLHRDGWHGVMNYAGFTRPVWAWLNKAPSTVHYMDSDLPLPRSSAEQAVRAIRHASAPMPWLSRIYSTNALSTHDAPRWRTIVGSAELQAVGAAAQVVMPGVPFLFAGDEIGVEGEDGEHARVPMPWHSRETWDHQTLETYRNLLALHRAEPALQVGGQRWLDAGEHSMTFLRTLGDQRVLVHLTSGVHAELHLSAQDLDADLSADLEVLAATSTVSVGRSGAPEPEAAGVQSETEEPGLTLSADGAGYLIARLSTAPSHPTVRSVSSSEPTSL